MKLSRIALSAAFFTLAGCMTLSVPDQSVLREHRVSEYLYQGMLRYQTLSLSNVVELSRKRLSSEFIIEYLRATGAVYRLGTADVKRLRAAGVSRDVTDYLVSTPRLFGPHYYEGPLWVEPCPGPGPGPVFVPGPAPVPVPVPEPVFVPGPGPGGPGGPGF